MTNREREILEIIKKNPMISQNELADMLSIARSSVAVHITNLVKKGHIKGKGYILKEEDYVCVLGGANIDIQGFPNSEINFRDSNPGQVKVSLGGVGRNIAENIAKLGIDTKLISIVGDDVYGTKLIEESRLSGVDMTNTIVLKGTNTSTYVSVLDEKGDMLVAISHMDICDEMKIEYVREKNITIKNSKICVVDTNMPEDVIEYLLNNYKDLDFFLDTVSTAKANKVKDKIGCFHTIKPNKIEAEMLSGIKIETEEDLEQASRYFIEKGVKRVFITLGGEGTFYNDGKKKGMLKNPDVELVNATGAGDSFIAALVYCYFNGFDIDYSLRFATAASALTISHENTINPNMSVENVKNKMKELSLC